MVTFSESLIAANGFAGFPVEVTHRGHGRQERDTPILEDLRMSKSGVEWGGRGVEWGGRGQNLRGQNLRGQNLRGQNLRGQNLR
jgi:hypothetical protein